MIPQTCEMTRKSSKVCSQKRRQVRHGESVLWRTAALQSGFAAKPFVSIRVHSWLALEHGNEMSQLILDVVLRCDRVGNLFLQQLSIAMAHAVKRLFHGVFGHSHFGGNFSLRRLAGFLGE